MLAFYKGFDLTYSWNDITIVRGGDQGYIKTDYVEDKRWILIQTNHIILYKQVFMEAIFVTLLLHVQQMHQGNL